MDTVGTFMMPPEASTIAADVDGLYYFLFYMSIFFMVLRGDRLVCVEVSPSRQT